eukprot:4738073-Prymnesium_polylepis.1
MCIRDRRVDDIADLMTEAFMESPNWIFVQPDEARRARMLRHINRLRLGLLGDRSEFWLGGDGAVEGHVVCACGNDMNPSFLTLVRLGFFTFPVRFGFPAFNRMLGILSALSAQSDAMASTGEDWTLEAFAIRASARGKGIGTRMLRHLLQQRVQPVGGRIWLMCQEEPARRLYARLGFADLESPPFSVHGTVLPNWTMERRFAAG